MRKYFCALLVLYLSLLIGAEMAWAELKPGQGVIDAMGIVTALGRILPGTTIQDVYADLGKPQSVSGESHQWWLYEVMEKDKRILADASLLYDITIQNGRVLYNSLVEIWPTQKQAKQRLDVISREWTKRFGKPIMVDGCPSWSGGKNLILAINLSKQSNGKWFILYYLFPAPAAAGTSGEADEEDELDKEMSRLAQKFVREKKIPPSVVAGGEIYVIRSYAAQFKEVKGKGAKLYVLPGEGGKAKTITSLKEGAALTAEAEWVAHDARGSWYYVTTKKGQSGWVPAQFITDREPE